MVGNVDAPPNANMMDENAVKAPFADGEGRFGVHDELPDGIYCSVLLSGKSQKPLSSPSITWSFKSKAPCTITQTPAVKIVPKANTAIGLNNDNHKVELNLYWYGGLFKR